MKKAIFSRIDLNNTDSFIAKEYVSCIQDLIHKEDIQQLKAYTQHFHTTRFQHSLNVSYYAFLAAKKLHFDAYSTARAGLLHDLYFYDWREDDRPEGRHCSLHPQLALENARKNCEVNEIMEDAIVHHMWPMTLEMPKTKEGWLIQAVDKYCAVSEILLQSGRKIRYSQAVVSMLAMVSILPGIIK